MSRSPQLLAWIAVLFLTRAAVGLTPPAGLLDRLSAEAYPERVKAEQELAEWALGEGKPAMHWMADQLDTAKDPEVRARVLSALKKVVIDDLTRKRPGFVGVRMASARVDHDGKVRMGVEISEVTPDSPAQKAGLKPNDVILELDGEGWETAEPQHEFARRVGKLGPGTRVRFRVYRMGELQDVELELAARPWSAGEYVEEGNRLVPLAGRLYLSEGQARDEAFRAWLESYRDERDAKR